MIQNSNEKKKVGQGIIVKEKIWSLLETYKFFTIFFLISSILIIFMIIFDLHYFEAIITLLEVFEEIQLDEFILVLVLITFGYLIDLYIHKLKVRRELKESREKYREAYNLVNLYKDLFAHDMNNILNGIISSAEFYSMSRNDPEMLEKLGDLSEVVKSHAWRGATLISNVRLLSRLDETGVELSPRECFNILNKSVGHTIASFQERDVIIKINGLSKDMKILGNEVLINIFDNILNNAVKYNYNEEEVKIEVNVSKILENDTQYIKFEFNDYGIGVPDERKETLFEKSYREDISKHGMGIGLSIVKKIVDKYGGKIWVEDRVEGHHTQGSNFVVMLKEPL